MITMEANYINLTVDNVANEHLCCLIRTKILHPGVEAKRQWLAQRLLEGHVFRKLDVKGCVFIEYAPLERAWVPIIGDNYMYMYCLWVLAPYKGQGYGEDLLTYCIQDAKAKGKSGICMLGSTKQRSWLSDQSFAKKHEFQIVDTTESGYDLLALSFDGSNPNFAEHAKKMAIAHKELTIYYDVQCPYTYQSIKRVKTFCEAEQIPVTFIKVDTLEKAKQLPCVFNNFAVFYEGVFKTVNLLDVSQIKRILKIR